MSGTMVWILVLVLVCVGNSAGSGSPFGAGFNFASLFQGEWDVKVTTANADEFVFEEFGPVFNRFTIAKADDTDGLSLTGTSFQNNSDTFEITNEQVVDIEFSDEGNTGTFKVGPFEDMLHPLFDFRFNSFGGISVGRWRGLEGGYYQFQFLDANTFIITVWTNNSEAKNVEADLNLENADYKVVVDDAESEMNPENAEDELDLENAEDELDLENAEDELGLESADVVLYYGKRVIHVVPKTLWQQYGSTLTIGGVFLCKLSLYSPSYNSLSSLNHRHFP